MNWLLNKLLGEAHYRIQYIYTDDTKKMEWHAILNTTHPQNLANCRMLKVESGPLWNDKEARPYLKNGSLKIGHICYLGRW